VPWSTTFATARLQLQWELPSWTIKAEASPIPGADVAPVGCLARGTCSVANRDLTPLYKPLCTNLATLFGARV
jgi:hypothetical protein